jgi:hypothetical protein
LNISFLILLNHLVLNKLTPEYVSAPFEPESGEALLIFTVLSASFLFLMSICNELLPLGIWNLLMLMGQGNINFIINLLGNNQ